MYISLFFEFSNSFFAFILFSLKSFFKFILFLLLIFILLLRFIVILAVVQILLLYVVQNVSQLRWSKWNHKFRDEYLLFLSFLNLLTWYVWLGQIQIAFFIGILHQRFLFFLSLQIIVVRPIYFLIFLLFFSLSEVKHI